MTTQTEGYAGHRPGSNKGKVHKAFDDAGKGDKGKAAAIKVGTKAGLAEATIRTWCSTWAKGKTAKKAAKKADTTKKAAASKKTAKKTTKPKSVKRERISEGAAA